MFSGLCGSLSYLLKVTEGQKFSWLEFILHILISSMCGFFTYQILNFYGVPPQVAGALCGMAGWMGTRFLRIIEIAFRKKLGVTKEDMNK